MHNHKIRTTQGSRAPIEQFAMDYDMPQGLANCLVGATERETAANIESMIDYLRMIANRYGERLCSK